MAKGDEEFGAEAILEYCICSAKSGSIKLIYSGGIKKTCLSASIKRRGCGESLGSWEGCPSRRRGPDLCQCRGRPRGGS